MKKLFLSILVIMTFSQLRAQDDTLQENDFVESPDGAQPPEQSGQTQQPTDQNFAPPAPSAESYDAAPGNPNGAFNPSKTPSLSSKGLSRFKAQKEKGLIGGKSGKSKAPPLSQATDADITNENYPDIIESFDFPNADISDVIKAISELTGKNFIVDPSVSGKITIMAPTQITVAEAYKVFLSALAIRGFAVVPSGKFLKILPVRDAQRDNIDIYSGAYTPDTDQMITRIIHLKYVPASEMNKFTSKLVSKNGNIDIYEPTNSLIVSDQASSVQRILKIVGQLDIASFDEQLVVIHIRYAKAKDMADLIEQIINKGQKNQNSSGFGGGIPRFRPGGSGQSSSSAYSTVIPDDRTNSIIVVGNKDGIEKIKKLVATLDNSPGTQGSGAYVYYVKYGDAEKIADILNGIAKSLKDEQKNDKGSAQNIPPPPTFDAFGNPYGVQNQNNTKNSSSGLFGADVKISADKQVNSLVIVGSKQDYQAVLALLKKIDIPRDQVYVETVIMEMDAQDSNNFGISYYHFDPSTGGLARAGFGGGGASAFSLNNLGSEGAILGFGTGDTVNLNVTNPGGVTTPGTTPTTGTVQVKSLMGLLNLIKSSAKTDILATPRILAMDNEKSVVEVGENVPVGLSSTATVAGSAPTQSVDRVDATIKLEIKPFISPSSESVRMELKQTIKDLAGSIADSATQLSSISRAVTNRSIETTLVVRDGDTAVLGGLMRNKTEVDVTKVPLLGDIPILGWLFKSSKTTMEKLNLIVFLTPKVIRNPEDNNMLLSKTLDDRIRYIKENEGGVDKFGARAEALRPKLRASQKEDKDIEDIEQAPDDEFIEKK